MKKDKKNSPTITEGRDELGRFKKGYCQNPTGRPNRSKMTKMLRELFGDDGKELYYILISQIYGVDIENVGIDNKIKDLLPESKKKNWRNRVKIDKRLASDNAKWIIEQLFGKSIQHSFNETELSTPEDQKIEISFIKSKDK